MKKKETDSDNSSLLKVPSSLRSFKTLIISEGENFASLKVYSENTAWVKFSFFVLLIRDHPHARSYPYFWKSSEQEEEK